nr:MAG TPA: hypothetical protein [Caudoviricetes sp.]
MDLFAFRLFYYCYYTIYICIILRHFYDIFTTFRILSSFQ